MRQASGRAYRASDANRACGHGRHGRAGRRPRPSENARESRSACVVLGLDRVTRRHARMDVEAMRVAMDERQGLEPIEMRERDVVGIGRQGVSPAVVRATGRPRPARRRATAQPSCPRDCRQADHGSERSVLSGCRARPWNPGRDPRSRQDKSRGRARHAVRRACARWPRSPLLSRSRRPWISPMAKVSTGHGRSTFRSSRGDRRAPARLDRRI